MKIFSRVCAEFHDADGNILFAITPATRLGFVEAPESIKQDLLFTLLVREGSLEVVDRDKNVALENDPMAGHDATGKSVEAAEKAEAKTTIVTSLEDTGAAEGENAEPAEDAKSGKPGSRGKK